MCCHPTEVRAKGTEGSRPLLLLSAGGEPQDYGGERGQEELQAGAGDCPAAVGHAHQGGTGEVY